MSLLSIEQFSLHRGSRVLVHDLSLQIKAGECCCILGANGVGKSSLFLALLGLLPYSGQVQWFGQDLKDYSRLSLAQKVGLLPQMTEAALGLRVKDYLQAAFYPQQQPDPSRLAAVLQRFQLNDLQNQPMECLSGGEQQRVAIAALMLQASPFALVDEPHHQLDPVQQSRLIREIVQGFKRPGHALMMIMHDMYLAQRFCDRFLLLKPGGDWRLCSEMQTSTPWQWLYDQKPKPFNSFYFD